MESKNLLLNTAGTMPRIELCYLELISKLTESQKMRLKCPGGYSLIWAI